MRQTGSTRWKSKTNYQNEVYNTHSHSQRQQHPYSTNQPYSSQTSQHYNDPRSRDYDPGPQNPQQYSHSYRGDRQHSSSNYWHANPDRERGYSDHRREVDRWGGGEQAYRSDRRHPITTHSSHNPRFTPYNDSHRARDSHVTTHPSRRDDNTGWATVDYGRPWVTSTSSDVQYGSPPTRQLFSSLPMFAHVPREMLGSDRLRWQLSENSEMQPRQREYNKSIWRKVQVKPSYFKDSLLDTEARGYMSAGLLFFRRGERGDAEVLGGGETRQQARSQFSWR